MSRILDLKEKRASAWDKAKKLLDSHEGETMSGEALAQYEKMETDIENMTREIEALERAEARDKILSAATSEPILGNPSSNPQGEEKTGRASSAYRNSFNTYMRNKSVSHDIMNALSIGVDSEGGILAPDEFEATLVAALEEENVFRRLATTIQTSSGDRTIPVAGDHGTAAWVDEGEKLEESDESFSNKTIGAHKLATLIKVSEELLNDSAFNLDAYLSNEFARRIGAKEEEAFFVGQSGKKMPTGIFDLTNGGEIGHTTSSALAISFDDIYDLFFSLKAPYRKNATWVLNDSTVKAIRKLKDANGQYLWQPSVSAGTPDTIVNRPYITSSYVPVIGSGNVPIAFGDFSYYWIGDRQGRSFKRLNEKYAETGQVGFISTERVDGKLILPEAVKLLKMGAASGGTVQEPTTPTE